MTAVFLKFLNMSLTASLLILAVLPIRMLMKKAPKWMTCLLWLIVAVALIAPVRLESRASVLPAENPIQITEAKPTPMPLTQDTPILIQDILEGQTANDESGYPVSMLEIGTALWCLGMTAMLGYGLFSTLRLKRQVAASLETEHSVFLCDDIDTPFILGIIRPHIYLPSALDEATAAQVLLHERAHLTRKDHWWKPLGYLLLTLHWFNPLVWVSYILLCTDIELACDEKVIKNMDAGSKQAYSEALLTCSMPRRMIPGCPLAFGEVSVKQRIKAVLHYKKPAFWVILIATVVCVALCLGFLTEPIVMTLSSIGNVSVEEIELVSVQSDGEILNQDRETLFEILSLVELQPEYLIKTSLDNNFHTIILRRRENAATYELCFSSDFKKLQLNRIVRTPHGTNQLYDKHYKVLNPEVLQNSDFLNSLLLLASKQGSNITLPIAIYPDMDNSFQGQEALYDAIMTHTELHADDLEDLYLVGISDRQDGSYAVIRYTAARPVRDEYCTLLEYQTNADGTVTILAFAHGSLAEQMGNYGYAMNVCQLGEKSIYWTTFRDKRWATTADGTETDTNQTVPTDYTGFRFIWADLQQKDYTADSGFFLAEVGSVIPPAIAIPMVGNKALTALGWRLP